MGVGNRHRADRGRGRTWWASSAAALAGLVALGGILATRASVGTPGLPWPSGVFIDHNTPDRVAAFEAWRGRKVDVALDWSDRATWEDIENASALYDEWRDKPYAMVFGVAMLPEAVPGVSLQACAQGDYNEHWRRFAAVIRRAGLGNAVIRLGWEFNGDWYRWSARDPQAWAGCWRQAVRSARTEAPNLRWDWNVNRGESKGLADPRQAWPGDDYVDIVGVDSYDQAPPAPAPGGWYTQLTGPQGLQYWLDFARAHGKPFSVPEWGNVVGRADGGGDDPAYVRAMVQFFRANARDMAFESVFQVDVKYEEEGNKAPRSAAAYRALYGDNS